MPEEYLFEVVVGVVRCPERGFLLMRRSEFESRSGKWEFGGGAVEDGESLEEAVRREMKEETGLEVELIEEGEPYFDDYSKGGKLKLYPFLLEVDQSDEVELSREHDKHKWLELEQINEKETLGRLRALEKLGLK